MIELPAQHRKDFFRTLASHLKINRVGTEVDLARPFQSADGRDGYLLEYARLVPGLKDAAASQMPEISNSGSAVVKAHAQPKTIERFNVGDLHAR